MKIRTEEDLFKAVKQLTEKEIDVSDIDFDLEELDKNLKGLTIRSQETNWTVR